MVTLKSELVLVREEQWKFLLDFNPSESQTWIYLCD